MASKSPGKGGGGDEPTRTSASPVIEEVRQLIELMVEHDLGEVDITDGDRKILLKRGISGGPPMAAAGPRGPAPAVPTPYAADQPLQERPGPELIEVKSPMVGTFYLAASPDTDPYASVGTVVSEDSVVCIVEAMKVMNEVKAECSGTIVEMCVKNAQPVEYGQVLFRVEPS
ncbi:MAG: acetyl-CoA carboxylase biotin carboxyl carrier protein [Phycisphaerae bacterium]